MKIYIILIIFGLTIPPLLSQEKPSKNKLVKNDISLNSQETISTQVQNIRMLLDIENMIAEMNETDENELIQQSIDIKSEDVAEKFKQLQVLKQMQIEYLESKEEEIDALLLKFNELERKSQMASNQ